MAAASPVSPRISSAFGPDLPSATLLSDPSAPIPTFPLKRGGALHREFLFVPQKGELHE